VSEPVAGGSGDGERRRSTIQIVNHPGGSRTVVINGQQLMGDAHIVVNRDHFGRVVHVDVRFYMPQVVETTSPKRHPNPHPWVQDWKNILGRKP